MAESVGGALAFTPLGSPHRPHRRSVPSSSTSRRAALVTATVRGSSTLTRTRGRATTRTSMATITRMATLTITPTATRMACWTAPSCDPGPGCKRLA